MKKRIAVILVLYDAVSGSLWRSSAGTNKSDSSRQMLTSAAKAVEAGSAWSLPAAQDRHLNGSLGAADNARAKYFRRQWVALNRKDTEHFKIALKYVPQVAMTVLQKVVGWFCYQWTVLSAIEESQLCQFYHARIGAGVAKMVQPAILTICLHPVIDQYFVLFLRTFWWVRGADHA